MRLSEYVDHDATGLASLVRTGEVTPLELTRLARAAHDEVNPRINAVVEFYEDAETVAGANAGLFHGVPFLRKDIGGSEGGRLQEKGSLLFKGYRPQTDSYFFRRARNAGLRTLGRTTTPEFGMSGFTESVLNGITGNPWDLERSAGGSSGGSAAAVAAGITPIAHGSDGSGSIRIPAAWCGLVGLNPSRGRISGGPSAQDALLGLTREFVLCRSVRDLAAALDIFSGPHPGDPFIIVQPSRTYIEELSLPTGTLKVGIARSKWGDVDIDPEILNVIDSTAALLEEMGHIVTEIDPPCEPGDRKKMRRKIVDCGLFLSAASLDSVARAMGREINAHTLEPINLELYDRARKSIDNFSGVDGALRSLRFRVGEATFPFDILLTPTMPKLALPHGGVYSTYNGEFSAEEFLEANDALYQYVGVFNITGHPSVSLPLAQSHSGLPIGVQIVGRFGDEATLVRIARDLEEAIPWSQRQPNIRAGSI